MSEITEPTPAQVLELFAQNIEAHHQKERARAALSVAYPDSAPFDDEAFVQARESFYGASDHAVHISQQALALDPALIRAQAAALAEQEVEPHNRWLPGEKGNTGIYADDYCAGGYLWVHEDFQGDVHISINKHPGPGLLSPVIRMAAHCVRRPHVINAARALARALMQPSEETPQ